MPESDALIEARKRKEQRLLQAKVSILRAIPDQEAIEQALNCLYVDWSNAFLREQAEQIGEQLKRAGVEVRKQDFTGDSSFPTEHTISIGTIRGMGPTFDLALLDFVQKLLRQNEEQGKEMTTMHKELRGLRHYKNATEPIIANMK